MLLMLLIRNRNAQDQPPSVSSPCGPVQPPPEHTPSTRCRKDLRSISRQPKPRSGSAAVNATSDPSRRRKGTHVLRPAIGIADDARGTKMEGRTISSIDEEDDREPRASFCSGLGAREPMAMQRWQLPLAISPNEAVYGDLARSLRSCQMGLSRESSECFGIASAAWNKADQRTDHSRQGVQEKCGI